MSWVESYRKRVGTESVIGTKLKAQSDLIMDATFTRDPNYKRVYILTPDGWKWEDAKYQTHSAPSITKDAVDYYLQFRPKIHYPVGSYVIVPDDTSPNINLTEKELGQPFTQPFENRTQFWIIVGRDEAPAYVRYMILKCNWDYRWVYNGKVRHCWGCARNSQSYTAGVWRDDLSQSLDDLNAVWMPDTYHVYGDKLESLGMDDTRTITYGQRFILTNNVLDPKVFEVTKIIELSPQGVIKLSIKQDSFNEKRDNIELRVCDYYTDEGDIQIDKPVVETPDNTKSSEIHWMYVGDDGELDYGDEMSLELLQIGQTSYFMAKFYDGTDEVGVDGQWRIELANTDGLSEEDISYYTGLMKLTKFDSSTVALKPAKASSLKGVKFILSVEDINGQYASSIEVEVSE